VDVVNSPSRTVSLEALLRWIYQGELFLAENVKGQYLTQLSAEHVGPFDNLDLSGVLRPLFGRVERRDPETLTYYRCIYRTMSEHRRLEASGRGATTEAPAYTYDGGALRIYPGGEQFVRIAYVQYPGRIAPSDVPDAPWIESGTDTLSIDPVLLPCLCLYVTAKAQRSLGRVMLHAWYTSLMQQWLRPLSRDFRIGTQNSIPPMRGFDREVNTEH
jgi:hypothetical protein